MTYIYIVSRNIVLIGLLKKIITNNINDCKIETYDRFSKTLVENNFDFNIVIVDEQIIGSSGFEVLDYLRFTKKFLNTIIFLSNSESESNKAMLLGANHIIIKPIVIDDFLDLIIKELAISGVASKNNKSETRIEHLKQDSDMPMENNFLHTNDSPTKKNYKKIIFWVIIILILISSVVFAINSYQKNYEPMIIEKKLELSLKPDEGIIDNHNSDSLQERKIQSDDLTNVDSLENNSIKQKTNKLNSQHLYYVIAGAFKVESNADKYVEQLKTQNYKAKKVDFHNGFYLVSYSKHENKKDAQTELNQIRREKTTAWIFQY